MPEELYNSHDYCTLAEELEKLKLENEELIADKVHLINAAMDGGDKYHYTAHDIAYRDLERKCKALEADYAVSNRELLILQVEISRLNAELARLTALVERLKEDAERLAKYCQHIPMPDTTCWMSSSGAWNCNCGATEAFYIHRTLMKELE